MWALRNQKAKACSTVYGQWEHVFLTAQTTPATPFYCTFDDGRATSVQET